MALPAGAANLDTLNGLVKETYADNVHQMIPIQSKLQNLIKFGAREKMPGNYYNQPLALQLEHGVTYADDSDGAFALNDAVSSVVRHARVKGAQMLLRSVIAYDLLAAAPAKGQRAFENATKYIVQAMAESMSKKLEVSLMYGQNNIGVVKAGSISGSSFAIVDAEWAPGVFTGSKDMNIEVFSPDFTVSRGVFKIASVNFDTKAITATTSVSAVQDLDVILPAGANGKEAAGLHKILSNTGTLFDISATQYELWKGNIENVGGDLTFDVLIKKMSRPVEKGLESDTICIVNPKTWASLMKDQAALRRFDSSFSTKKLENGTMAIEFFHQAGKIEVHSSIYCKEGYGYVIAVEDFLRIGSTDVTFSLPGLPDNFLTIAPNNAGYELRCYSNQAMFCKSIGRTLLLTGITHS